MGVRNLVAHPGWHDPSSQEAIEMLAVLSYVAHLVQISDVVELPDSASPTVWPTPTIGELAEEEHE
jgi:hypothetical protein